MKFITLFKPWGWVIHCKRKNWVKIVASSILTNIFIGKKFTFQCYFLSRELKVKENHIKLFQKTIFYVYVCHFACGHLPMGFFTVLESWHCRLSKMPKKYYGGWCSREKIGFKNCHFFRGFWPILTLKSKKN